MAHGPVLAGPVPVFFVGCNPYGITGFNQLFRLTGFLDPTLSFRDIQELPGAVGMPGGAGTGLEGDQCGTDTRWAAGFKVIIDSYPTGEGGFRALKGLAGSIFDNFHDLFLCR